jgi:hypothetical protein
MNPSRKAALTLFIEWPQGSFVLIISKQASTVDGPERCDLITWIA